MTDTTGRRGKILVVDDQPNNLEVLANMLIDEGYGVLLAHDGERALDIVDREAPDLVLLDIVMPRLSGIDVCRRIKSNPATRLTPVVLVTGLDDGRSRIEGIEAGADDLMNKPVSRLALQARVRSLLKLKRYTDELDTAEAVIMSLALTIEARDSYTDGHCQRLARYARALGHYIGLDQEEVSALERSGYLHDVGKIGVSDALLLKPERLTSAEHDQIKQHTIIGDRLCGELRFLRSVRPIVRHHHERLDGSGYPDGLKGDRIPLLAQIVGVVDVYDAITTARPYKPAYSAERAYDELCDEVHLGWRRRDLVDALVAVGAQGLLDTTASDRFMPAPSLTTLPA